jgi:hypothetical protein
MGLNAFLIGGASGIGILVGSIELTMAAASAVITAGVIAGIAVVSTGAYLIAKS